MKRWFASSSHILTDLSKFVVRKTGTGSGPFVEFPDFQLLQGSLLLRIPSSSTVFSKLEQVGVFNVPPETALPFMNCEKLPNGFTKLITGAAPVNLICHTRASSNNLKVLEVDDYGKGWKLMKPASQVIFYSGDLSFNEGKLLGRGLVALMTQGPLHELKLNGGEEMLIAPESIVGYFDCKIEKLEKLDNSIAISQIVKKYGTMYLGKFYDQLLYLMSRVIRKDKLYFKVRGPGIMLLQSHYALGSQSYSRDEILRSMK
ncbi:uncharacterized protein Ecym_3199 [Eremothecium cymbalariae DBVPG|uniref:Altered inheritance of mitochondria protein 24, mitochondrial n=1 Tax=Eremothecium cymbalariae (strain CBS 270.75 / DBVPG 7215 / KCTC 17166 / NRRL Y-17582) TaxID=931890 RepID=G8JRC9_ERECY|nr:Hypothetical protein Ecym_3199 [Eremothecium cymbalariae DBVPG\